MCTFDIVPSLGPQSQVLNPARASVFVHSLRSVNTVRDRHPLQVSPPQLLNSCSHGNSLAPATCARHPSQVLIGSCPTHNPQLPTRRSEKGPARPRNNPNHHLLYVEATSNKQGLSQPCIPIPQFSLIVAIACIKTTISTGIKECGK